MMTTSSHLIVEISKSLETPKEETSSIWVKLRDQQRLATQLVLEALMEEWVNGAQKLNATQEGIKS